MLMHHSSALDLDFVTSLGDGSFSHGSSAVSSPHACQSAVWWHAALVSLAWDGDKIILCLHGASHAQRIGGWGRT